MYKLITRIKNNQVKFFIWYFVIVFTLQAWSYFEGVLNIQGTIFLPVGKEIIRHTFMAGYLTSFNYGLYYIIVLPFFLRSLFTTYFRAETLSNLQDEGQDEEDLLVKKAVENYSSKIIDFLKMKRATYLFFGLLLFFIYQNIIVEKSDFTKLSLGWAQGIELKKNFHTVKDTVVLHKKFYFRDNLDINNSFIVQDSVKVGGVSFSSERTPNTIEFICFVVAAKLFFALFTTIVFFFNFNLLFGLFAFFKENNKGLLFKSEKFVNTTEKLISSVSLSGFFLTIFLYCRYIANSQKGSFKSFDWDHFFSNDQYLFIFGMLFIPISSAVLFTYVYISNKTIDIKGFTLKKLVDFYLPNIAFIFIFMIYILTFSPHLSSQFKFVANFLLAANKFLVG